MSITTKYRMVRSQNIMLVASLVRLDNNGLEQTGLNLVHFVTRTTVSFIQICIRLNPFAASETSVLEVKVD
jgi:hypothetical protein